MFKEIYVALEGSPCKMHAYNRCIEVDSAHDKRSVRTRVYCKRKHGHYVGLCTAFLFLS